MKKIRHAKFLKSVEAEGTKTAEVEFAWEGDFGAGMEGDRYVAVLKKEGDAPFKVERVMKNDVDYELDWFDNANHQAYQDVTEQLFDGKPGTDSADRERFVRDVLGFEEVCSDMECRRD